MIHLSGDFQSNAHECCVAVVVRIGLANDKLGTVVTAMLLR
jgi:hypothetical protein